jgi:hypothetical protein
MFMPIMSILRPFLTRHWAKIALAVAVLGLLVLARCQGARTAGAEARLSKETAASAIESGGDAVNTVGAVSASEAATDVIGRTNDAEIRKAEGAGQVVPVAVDAAGRASLCRRAAYRSDPRCLRQPAP